MATLKDRIIDLLEKEGGISDREITDKLMGKEAPQQSVNIMCRNLEQKGIITRIRVDGKIRNCLANGIPQPPIRLVEEKVHIQNVELLSEDMLKKHLEKWLIQNGWKAEVAWGHQQGIDICAEKENKRWIIEVKGIGSRQPMRVNYFLSILGETLQRMDDPNAEYSIALPDMQQYRNLWNRLPHLAKQRTEISILFVDEHGIVTQKK